MRKVALSILIILSFLMSISTVYCQAGPSPEEIAKLNNIKNNLLGQQSALKNSMSTFAKTGLVPTVTTKVVDGKTVKIYSYTDKAGNVLVESYTVSASGAEVLTYSTFMDATTQMALEVNYEAGKATSETITDTKTQSAVEVQYSPDGTVAQTLTKDYTTGWTQNTDANGANTYQQSPPSPAPITCCKVTGQCEGT